MHRLPGERRGKAASAGEAPGLGEHVARDVDAIHVEPGFQERQEQPSGATGKVERRLTEPLDRVSVAREFVRLRLVELGPPPGHEAVMPGLGHVVHTAPFG